jgi:hypothetical protein
VRTREFIRVQVFAQHTYPADSLDRPLHRSELCRKESPQEAELFDQEWKRHIPIKTRVLLRLFMLLDARYAALV